MSVVLVVLKQKQRRGKQRRVFVEETHLAVTVTGDLDRERWSRT